MLIALANVGCGRKPVYRYSVPERTNDGWETASMGSVNLDGGLITNLFKQINNHAYKNIHSVLLVRNGKLVVEEYFPGTDSSGAYHAYQRERRHEIHSVTKSVNAILIGISIDQHFIKGVDEKISLFFPEYSDAFAGGSKSELRLKHLLTMSSGLSWDEWKYPYTDTRNDLNIMDRSKDQVRYFLERPVVARPGEQFCYSGGICLTLGEITHHSSGLSVNKFADRYLFGPLGITNYYWWTYSNGIVDTGGGLALRPRDMAKIGFLYLNGGRWQGKQIVSEKWVRDSTTNYVDASQFPNWIRADGYGYNWWLRSFHVGSQEIQSYHAAGRGGQFIFVFPRLQLVAVFTGWNDNSMALQPFDMLQRYILPAVGPEVVNGTVSITGNTDSVNPPATKTPGTRRDTIGCAGQLKAAHYRYCRSVDASNSTPECVTLTRLALKFPVLPPNW